MALDRTIYSVFLFKNDDGYSKNSGIKTVKTIAYRAGLR